MFTKSSTATSTSTSTKTSGRTVARAAAGLALALTAGVASTGAAQAWTYSGSVPVLPTVYRVVGTHINIGTPASAQWVRRVAQNGPNVTRINPSGTEYVSVSYNVYRWNGSAWAKVATASNNGQIGAGSVTVKLPGFRHDTFSAGYYYVDETITWTTPIGGVIRSLTVNMNQSGDYACNTTFSCNASQGYIYLS